MKTYNWEGVNPDGYFLDKLEPIPSGLTPSQLHVFMPPNLGGFFMVRDRKSGSAGMPRPDVVCRLLLEKKKKGDRRHKLRHIRIIWRGTPDASCRCLCAHRVRWHPADRIVRS